MEHSIVGTFKEIRDDKMVFEAFDGKVELSGYTIQGIYTIPTKGDKYNIIYINDEVFALPILETLPKGDEGDLVLYRKDQKTKIVMSKDKTEMYVNDTKVITVQESQVVIDVNVGIKNLQTDTINSLNDRLQGLQDAFNQHTHQSTLAVTTTGTSAAQTGTATGSTNPPSSAFVPSDTAIIT